MMMSNVDKVESQRQEAAVKRKEAALEAQLRKKKKEEEMERMLMERQEESNLLIFPVLGKMTHMGHGWNHFGLCGIHCRWI